jgi:large subunit ribosomal protein L20
VLKLAKGYFGAKSRQYRAASEQVARSLRYAYEGRKMRKRDSAVCGSPVSAPPPV